MPVLCTPLQVKCYPFDFSIVINYPIQCDNMPQQQGQYVLYELHVSFRSLTVEMVNSVFCCYTVFAYSEMDIQI